MATRSKKLVFEIRDILGDLSRARIRANSVLYNLLSKYQREFMALNTTRAKFTITLTTATSYTIDTTVSKIIRVYGPDAQETEYYYTYDPQTRAITLTDDEVPVAGEIIYYDAFLKPITEITANIIPVIDAIYDPYLKEAVLTNFPTKGIPQTEEKIEKILARVRRLALDSMDEQRFSTKKPFNLNF